MPRGAAGGLSTARRERREAVRKRAADLIHEFGTPWTEPSLDREDNQGAGQDKEGGEGKV